MDITQLNSRAWKVVDRYLNLKVGKQVLQTPYFTNDVCREFGRMLIRSGLEGEQVKKLLRPVHENQIPFGWFWGKGSPDQIEEAAEEVARIKGVDVNTFTKEGAREFLLAKGLGVDCSGFAYNIYTKVLGEDVVEPVLDWNSEIHEPYKARANVFAGKASESVDPENVRPLDMLLFRKVSGADYSHVAIILERDGWRVVQSTSTGYPMGVGVSGLMIRDNELSFDFVPSQGRDWNELYREGRIEVRRLKILK